MCYNIDALSVFSGLTYTYYTLTANPIFISPNFSFIFVLIILCVCISVCINMSVSVQGGQKRALDLLDLEQKVVMSCPA